MNTSLPSQPLQRATPFELPVRVVQFGQGNFLRAFLGWQLQVYNTRCQGDLGVVVVRPTSRSTAPLLDTQDGLYTTLLRGLDTQGQLQTQVDCVSCVQRELDLARHYADFLALARNPDVRYFVSNTTEAGIVVNGTDRLDDAPASTFPAKLTRWLYERYQHFGADPARGVVLLPCELIESNGVALRAAVGHYADLWQLAPGFAAWLDDSCAFCSTLVDRIVTGYPSDEATSLQASLGYRDSFMVCGELYHLWAIQAPDWVARELPLEKAGLNVQWVDDLRPVRDRKVAVLNGAHTLLAAVGPLMGLETVRSALEDLDVAAFLTHTLQTEVLPGLPGDADTLRAYTDEVVRRFRNPFLHHALSAIALNMESKCLTRLWPSLERFHTRSGRFPPGLLLGLAAARIGLHANGTPTPALDQQATQIPDLGAALDSTEQNIRVHGMRDLLRNTI